MNDMKEHLIDLKFNTVILNKIYSKFINFFILKNYYLLLVLPPLFYLIFIYNLKYCNNMKMDTLSDFTLIHNINFLNEFELIYILLSYKLNTRLILKMYVKKEDLVISLSNLYL